MNEFDKLYALLYRTEKNIDFYLNNNKPNSALNEIGVMRGIIYSIEALQGIAEPLTEKELSYIELQQELKAIDEEESTCQK